MNCSCFVNDFDYVSDSLYSCMPFLHKIKGKAKNLYVQNHSGNYTKKESLENYKFS